MRKLIVMLTLGIVVVLSACSGEDATTEDLDEVTYALEEGLFVWDEIGFINNMIYEEDGEVVQHLKMTMHVDREGKLYLEVEDLTDGDSVLVSYVFIEAGGSEAYLYDHEDYIEEGTESYRIEVYEEVAEAIPNPNEVFQYLVYNLPRHDVEDEALNMNHYRVDFDGDEVDVNISLDFRQDSETETLVWEITGHTEDFTFKSPDTGGAEIRFFKSDFFETFTGIDKNLHE